MIKTTTRTKIDNRAIDTILASMEQVVELADDGMNLGMKTADNASEIFRSIRSKLGEISGRIEAGKRGRVELEIDYGCVVLHEGYEKGESYNVRAGATFARDEELGILCLYIDARSIPTIYYNECLGWGRIQLHVLQPAYAVKRDGKKYLALKCIFDLRMLGQFEDELTSNQNPDLDEGTYTEADKWILGIGLDAAMEKLDELRLQQEAELMTKLLGLH